MAPPHQAGRSTVIKVISSAMADDLVEGEAVGAVVDTVRRVQRCWHVPWMVTRWVRV